MTSTQSRTGGLEIRSIDYVPLSERHGKVWHLGPLWFMSNAQIATLAVGLISITEGGVAVLVGARHRGRRADRHAVHGVPLGAGPAARPAADDPVAAAVRVHRRAARLAVRLRAVRRVQRLQHHPRRRGHEHDRARRRSSCGWSSSPSWRWSSRWSATTSSTRREQWLTYLMSSSSSAIFTITLFFIHYPAGTFDLGTFKASPFLAPVRRGRRLPDQLGDLRLGLLPLPAAGRDRPQDLLLDLLGVGARRASG